MPPCASHQRPLRRELDKIWGLTPTAARGPESFSSIETAKAPYGRCANGVAIEGRGGALPAGPNDERPASILTHVSLDHRDRVATRGAAGSVCGRDHTSARSRPSTTQFRDQGRDTVST